MSCFLLNAGRNLLCSMSTYLSMFTVTVCPVSFQKKKVLFRSPCYYTATSENTPKFYFCSRNWLFHVFMQLMLCPKLHVLFVHMAVEMEVGLITKDAVSKILVFFDPLGNSDAKFEPLPHFFQWGDAVTVSCMDTVFDLSFMILPTVL